MLDILNAGCILRNRYEVRDLIFCGEKDAIYLIEDLNPPHEELALREFIPSSKSEIEGNEKFWYKIENISRIKHPNLVEFFDFFTEVPEGKSDKRHYIVMEYVKGRTMEEIFQVDLREDPVPTKMLIKQMIKVCAALKHLNSQDPPIPFEVLTPAHIILTPDRRIKLFNYGLGNLLRTGFCSKKPGFAAPEQVTKGIINEKTDVFSFGATIHYLLTGQNPEKKPDNFDPISAHNRDVPPELDKFILKCVSHRPDERPTIKDCTNFLLSNYMGRSKVKSPPRKPISEPPPPPPEVDTGDELDKFIEFVPQIEVTIEEPSRPDDRGTDIFSLSGEEKLASPSLERTVPGPRRPVSLRDKTEEYKNQFQKSVKRGTRRFDANRYMAVKKVLKGRTLDTPLASQKAKESIQKSADLLARIASSKKINKLSAIPTIPAKEVKPASFPEHKEKQISQKPVEEEIPVIEKAEKPEEIPVIEKTEETIEDKKELSLAEKLALKYKKKKEEKDDSEEQEDPEEKVKIQKISYGTPKVSHLTDWREQIANYCQPKPDEPPLLPPLQEGSVIKDRYEIAELIDQDCYGAVYMAFDRQEQDSQEAIRAIKEIQYKPPSDNRKLGEKILANFSRFGNKLKSLSHPNLIEVKDYFFSYSGDRSTIRLFLVMEFIEGYKLEDVIKTHQKKDSRMPSVTIFALLTKVCDALYYLHTNSPPRAHTDLTPKNILLTYSGEVKLINYSLKEVFMDDNEPVYPFYGTAGYFAPEQTDRDINNTKADVFALGAITYYLLTDINPESRPYEFLPLRKANPYISANVEEIVELCIKIDPGERASIKTIRDKMSTIKLVELDASLMEQQKARAEKRKASMSEIGNVAPLSQAFGKIALVYILPLIILVILGAVGYKLADHLLNRPVQGPKLYLSIASEKLLREIDLQSNRFTKKTIDLKVTCENIVASPGKKQAYVNDGSLIYTVDTEETKKYLTYKLDIKSVSFMFLNSDGTKLYLLSNKKNILNTVDIITKTVSGEVTLPDGPVAACLSYDGQKIYIINTLKDTYLTVVDAETMTVEKKIPVDKSPTDVVATKEGVVFVTHKNEDLLTVINVTTGKADIISTKKDEQKSQPTKLLLNNSDLYVINQQLKEIMILNTKNLNITDRIPFEGYPREMRIWEGKLYIYLLEAVGVKRKYSIIVFDIATKKHLTKILLDGPVQDMAIGAD